MSERERRLREIVEAVKAIYGLHLQAIQEAEKKLKRAVR